MLTNGFRFSVTGTDGIEVVTRASSSGVALPFRSGTSMCFDMVRRGVNSSPGKVFEHNSSGKQDKSSS